MVPEKNMKQERERARIPADSWTLFLRQASSLKISIRSLCVVLGASDSLAREMRMSYVAT